MTPVSVSEAADNYLGGNPLTAQQEGMVDTAIRALGTPPDGAPPITRAARATTAQPAAPTPPPSPIVPAPRAPTAPAAFPPAFLRGWKFVKPAGGAAIYEITPTGLVHVPSWDVFLAKGGAIGPNATTGGNTLVAADDSLVGLPGY